MSFADDEEFDSFIGRDHILPHITPEAVANALKGYTLELAPSKDMAWMARAVRRSLAIVSRTVEVSDLVSPSETRAKMEELTTKVDETWSALFDCDSEVDARIWAHAWSQWEGEGGVELDGELFGDPVEYRRFQKATSELNWLAGFLRSAAAKIESQRGPWRTSMMRTLRVERALLLASIFETAFGAPVSANNFPSDARHRAPTPFMDFYARISTLAFGQLETTNLAEVVKIACKLHRQDPARFGQDVIPGL